MNYSRKRANAQIQMSSLKYIDIDVDTTLSFLNIDEGTVPNTEIINDIIISEDSAGKKIKVPVREFLKMKLVEEGAEHFESEGDSDEIKMPTGIKIVSKEGRVDQSDRPVYPVHSYNLFQEFLDSMNTDNRMSWDELVESGLRDDNDFSQVQNYTIELV